VPSVDRGTWQELNAQEQLLAAQRGTKVQAELGLVLGSDVRAGDFVTVMGASWEVVDANDLRSRRRALLRKES
jgi:hypothetical protein